MGLLDLFRKMNPDSQMDQDGERVLESVNDQTADEISLVQMVKKDLEDIGKLSIAVSRQGLFF